MAKTTVGRLAQVTFSELIPNPAFPLGVMGEPGMGKTHWGKSLERDDYPVEIITLSQRDVTEVGGLPIVYRQKIGGQEISVADRALPSWFVNLKKAGRGLLIIDELTTCPASLQAPALRILGEKMIDNHKLPDEVAVVTFFNNPQVIQGLNDLSPQMVNRMRLVQIRVDADAWVDGMLTNWGRPLDGGNVTPEVVHWRAQIAGYIMRNPGELQQFPEQTVNQLQPWPSCRSWDNACYEMAAIDKRNKETKTNIQPDSCLASFIGPAAAQKFGQYFRMKDIPDPHKLLRDPDSWNVPDEISIRIQTMASIYSTVSNELAKKTPTENNKDKKVLEYVTAMLKLCAKCHGGGSQDISYLFLKRGLDLREQYAKMADIPPDVASMGGFQKLASAFKKSTK
jgi:hypothetical protein